MKLTYLQTQMPLPNTIPDLWRLCYDHKSTSIVMLNEVEEAKQEEEEGEEVLCFNLLSYTYTT